MTENEASEAGWSRFDHPAPVSLGYVHRWALATALQADRLENSSGGIQRIIEADLMLVSLYNLRKAARHALCSVQGDEVAKGQIRRAIDEFDRAVPDIQNMRAVVEHFDDYELGKGDAQQSGQRARRVPDRVLADSFQVDYFGPAGSSITMGDNTLDARSCAPAARALRDSVYAALRTHRPPST